MISAIAFLGGRIETRTYSQNGLGEVHPQNVRAAAAGVSPRVSSFGPAVPDGSLTGKKTADEKALEIPNNLPFRKQIENAPQDGLNRLADQSSLLMPAPLLSFEGLNSNDNAAAYGFRVLPPDTVGDVGFDHYVQAVNLLVRVFDKSGNALTPPFKLSSLFAPLGTPCSTRNDGDPIVLFDPLANRWILSQFCTQAPPFRQMVAISKTGDPTGEYFIYEFVMPNVKLNDYAKFGVWTDGYYMSTDEFVGSDYAGSGVFAFDRSKLLNGDPTASYIYFDLASPTTLRIGGLLPSDLDGLRAPPAGAANIFVGYTATEYQEAADAIRLFDFKADFVNPENSTFSERPESPIAVAPFDPTSPAGREDIAQPTPGEKLDSQSDRLMYRVAYRNFGAFDSLVFNQTVRVTPANQTYRAGVRLYEFRRNLLSVPPFQPFAVSEAATIGSVETSRFMGAAAQDHQGNLAVGYSSSNEAKKPAISYTGRLATETPGTFRIPSDLMIGTGVQTAFGFRWGDYSGLSVDPVDDCSFWITNQYYSLESQEESDFGWLTRIGKFRFSECVDEVRTRIAGTVTNAANGQPIEGATITADSVYSRSTNALGNYAELLVIPGASYELRASARGFRSVTRSVSASGGGTIVENFSLQPIAVLENSGVEIAAESCAVNNAVEPGETVTMNIAFRNAGASATSNLFAVLQQSGGIINPGAGQNFGALPPGGPSVARPFTFTASPNLNCGAEIVLTFSLNDGAEDLGTVTIPIRAGRTRLAFSENFDSANSPALPVGWTTSATGAQQNWTTSVNQIQSPPNSAFSPDPNQIGLNELVSPGFPVVSPNAELEFRNWYELETTFLRNRLYDGSVLEIKIGAGVWQDIETAGGAFLTGGYDGVIDSCCSNPLAGRRGWSGRSGVNQISEWITSKAKLPPSAAGNNVQLRWRVGTDIGTFRTGQFIDNISVTDGYVCDCATAARRAPFDFEGDGRTDLSLFRPSDNPAESDFFVRRSSNDSPSNNSWGSVGDLPVNSDYDGDGKTDLAVFRSSTRTWFILGSVGNSISAINFGLASDVPTPADYDGDGKSDIAVFRPSDGVWYILKSSDSLVRIERFGLSGDLTVQADYDGDQKADVAVFRPSTGVWYIYQSASGTVRIENFGVNGDRPVPGDFDGDGRTDLSLFRPSQRIWYQLKSATGFSTTQFGLPDDKPLQADFDGDGVRDIGVYRPSSGVWYYIGSSGSTFSVAFGQAGDVAVPSIFVP
ncbi:MAG: VCBS repeat-containing protein [Acidobacteria bacterium]|nr:VCBS repeat-containing protein [Acidobacteriota bacterium]